MKADRLVSVIVPCFNQGRYLGEALDSILAQSYPRWECIVVNDGSTDETHRVAERYCRKDPRIRYVTQSNAGLSAARNVGLEIATGDLFQFLDADDLILPEAMATMVGALSDIETPALAYCNWYRSQLDGVPVMTSIRLSTPTLQSERPLLDLIARWETDLSIPAHCFLFDARLFRDHHIRFDVSLPTHEDWDCWMRVLALRPTLVKVDAMLVVYRWNEHGKSRNMARMIEGVERICNQHRRLARDDRELARQLALKQVAMRRYYRRLRTRDAWESLPAPLLRGFHNHVPWPIQRLLYRFITP